MNLPSTLDQEALGRQIAAWLDPDALLDAEDIGLLLKCSGRYVLEWHAKAEGFPPAVRLPGPDKKLGHPRWKRRHILEYLDELFPKLAAKPGRPRRVGVSR